MILALDQSGEIVGQGTFQDLNLPRSYIHNLEDVSADEKGDKTIDDTVDLGDARKKSNSDAKATDEGRKTGDWSTYKYYIRALGPWRMLLFLLLVSVNETFTGLESRFFSGYLSKMMLTRCRCLAKLVGIEQRQWRRTKARLLAWNVQLHGYYDWSNTDTCHLFPVGIHQSKGRQPSPSITLGSYSEVRTTHLHIIPNPGYHLTKLQGSVRFFCSHRHRGARKQVRHATPAASKQALKAAQIQSRSSPCRYVHSRIPHQRCFP